jgi:hypothetical protein
LYSGYTNRLYCANKAGSVNYFWFAEKCLLFGREAKQEGERREGRERAGRGANAVADGIVCRMRFLKHGKIVTSMAGISKYRGRGLDSCF